MGAHSLTCRSYGPIAPRQLGGALARDPGRSLAPEGVRTRNCVSALDELRTVDRSERPRKIEQDRQGRPDAALKGAYAPRGPLSIKFVPEREARFSF
jgi:hypothetical protein